MAENDLTIVESATLSNNQRDLQEYAFLSQVADMYYNQNMMQADIARRLRFSRSKVSRLLTRARETGIVDIEVKHVKFSFDQYNMQAFAEYSGRGRCK